MGRPKALVELDGEPLVLRALLPGDVEAVVAHEWAEGMGASLRTGLAALERTDSAAALVHLVDLPGVTAAAVSRLLAHGAPDALVRAAYAGRPGHPVLLGREHWAGVRAAATGDAGARTYLSGHPALALVECGDVATPDDVDTPEQLARFR